MLGKDVKFKIDQIYKVTSDKNAVHFTSYILHVTNLSQRKHLGVIFETEDSRHSVDGWNYEYLSDVDNFRKDYPEYFL